ncbi:MAG: hypothetical protein QM778_18330 [Myxococcales bacterium]
MRPDSIPEGHEGAVTAAVAAYLSEAHPELNSDDRARVLSVVQSYVTPMGEAKSPELVQMQSPVDATQRKVGRLILGVAGLVGAVKPLAVAAAAPAVLVAGVAVPALAIASIGAALAIYSNSDKLKGEKLHRDEAIVLWTLWVHKNRNTWTAAESLLERLNEQRASERLPFVDESALQQSLRRLEDAKIIEATNEPRGWTMKEQITMRFARP